MQPTIEGTRDRKRCRPEPSKRLIEKALVRFWLSTCGIPWALCPWVSEHFLKSFLLFLGTMLLFLAGCSHSGDFESRARGFTGVITPHPPIFFTGPACVLLTNTSGFSARVTAQTEGLTESERNYAGQLLGLGTKLLFAPDPGAIPKKQGPEGGFSFIWDAAENRGFVLSEALQAYAPVSASTHVTNLVVSSMPAVPQKLAGHTCELAQATAQKDDGGNALFELLRATDLKGFPLRISSGGTNSTPLTLTFSKVRLEPPGTDVFAPPDGFTKYSSPEAMADELAARNHNLRRKRTDDLQPISGYPPSR